MPALPGRLAQLPPSAFAKLAILLDGVAPGDKPISLAVGDPQGEVPAFVTEAITRHADKFGVYLPINGTQEWREAATGWLKRRFALPNVDPAVLPLNGTREGLFLAPFIVTPESKAGGRPRGGRPPSSCCLIRSISATRPRRCPAVWSRCSRAPTPPAGSFAISRPCRKRPWSARPPPIRARRPIPKEPAPAQSIGERCLGWRTSTISRSDETHVAANRVCTVERFALVERLLGSRTGFRLPEGGFFLWLEIGDGEQTALKLWHEGGVRVLPGATMGREIDPGKPRTNPGFPYIRVALVNDLSTIMKALERMVEIPGSESP